MNGNKLFAASLAILALALGFFLGNINANCSSCCCSKGEMTCCKKGGMPCEHSAMNAPGAPCDCVKGQPCNCEKNGQPCHCPNCAKHGHDGHGPKGDFSKGPKNFKGPNLEAIDSLLQVTPEQKAALEASRAKGDSIFKDLRAQKHDAEKALGAALESGDQKAIDVAKAQVLDADKALLEHRINGVAGLAKILSKEQLDKFNQFHKEQMKKFKDRMKEGHHGPKGPKGPHEGHHEGPHGELPPPPPQQ